MSARIAIVALVLCLPTPLLAQSKCPVYSSDYYKREYEKTGSADDLECYNRWVKEEQSRGKGMTLGPDGKSIMPPPKEADFTTSASFPYDCSRSAQFYEDAYKARHRASDLVCFRKALQRELQ